MILGVFDHVTIRVSDVAASRAFYELLLDPRPQGDGSVTVDYGFVLDPVR